MNSNREINHVKCVFLHNLLHNILLCTLYLLSLVVIIYTEIYMFYFLFLTAHIYEEKNVYSTNYLRKQRIWAI